MWYGGMLVGWTVPLGSVVRVGGRGLVGFGYAELPYQYTYADYGWGPPSRRRHHDDRSGPGPPRTSSSSNRRRRRLPPDEDGVVRRRRRLSGDCRRQRPRPGTARRLRQRRDQVRTVLAPSHVVPEPRFGPTPAPLSPPARSGRAASAGSCRALRDAVVAGALPPAAWSSRSAAGSPSRSASRPSAPCSTTSTRTWSTSTAGRSAGWRSTCRCRTTARRSTRTAPGSTRWWPDGRAGTPRGGGALLLPEPDRLQRPLPVQQLRPVQRAVRALRPHPVPREFPAFRAVQRLDVLVAATSSASACTATTSSTPTRPTTCRSRTYAAGGSRGRTRCARPSGWRPPGPGRADQPGDRPDHGALRRAGIRLSRCWPPRAGSAAPATGKPRPRCWRRGTWGAGATTLDLCYSYKLITTRPCARRAWRTTLSI